MTYFVIYMLVGVALIHFAFGRGPSRRRAIRAVADSLGVEAFDRSLDGEVDGYEITTEHVKRGSTRAIILEIKLHSVPEELGLEYDPWKTAGTPVFEGYTVSGEGQEWLTESRRRALVELAGWVGSVSLQDRWLEIELDSEPLQSSALRETVEWLVRVGRILDDSGGRTIPPPIIHRRRLNGCLASLALGVLLFVIGLAGTFGLLWLFTDDEPPTRGSIEVPADAPAENENEPPGVDLFEECLEAAKKSPQLELAACEGLLHGDLEQATEQRRSLNLLKLHKTVRIDLDREQARALFETLAKMPPPESDSSPRRSVRDQEVALTELAYDVGLLDEYHARESFGPGAVRTEAAASLDVMLHSGATFESTKAPSRNMLDAARCLAGIDPGKPPGRHGTEIFVACGMSPIDRSHMNHPGERLAALEREPAHTLHWTIGDHRRRVDTTREFQAATVALELATPDAVPNRMGYHLDGVAEKIKEPRCPTPWAVDEANLAPELLVRAIPEAGPLAPRYRLWAARQYRALGNLDAMREVLAPIEPTDAEAICAAQLQTAIGDSIAAIERLLSVEQSAERDLALAHAYIVERDWKGALRLAQGVLRGKIHGSSRSAASLVAIVAALELGRSDGLNREFGPIPDHTISRDEQAFEHPVLATRWFAEASRARGSEHRWNSPDYLPLLPGSEPLQLYVASKLAPVDKMDFWLDTLLPPSGFEPFGYIEARLIVAQMRGDEKGIERWQRLADEHASRIENVSDVRLVRIARTLSPATR